jgi:hypothetical protein
MPCTTRRPGSTCARPGRARRRRSAHDHHFGRRPCLAHTPALRRVAPTRTSTDRRAHCPRDDAVSAWSSPVPFDAFGVLYRRSMPSAMWGWGKAAPWLRIASSRLRLAGAGSRRYPSGPTMACSFRWCFVDIADAVSSSQRLGRFSFVRAASLTPSLLRSLEGDTSAASSRNSTSTAAPTTIRRVLAVLTFLRSSALQ